MSLFLRVGAAEVLRCIKQNLIQRTSAYLSEWKGILNGQELMSVGITTENLDVAIS